MIVAFFGAGAVTAAFLVAGRVAGSRRRMAVTLGALGVGILLFSVTPWLPLGLPLLALAGFGYLGSNTSATTRLALGVEPWQRGRIMALWSIAFLGLRPVASLVDGAIAGAFGVRVAGAVLALPALAGAAFASDYASVVAKLACLLVLAVIAVGCGSSVGQAVRPADARARARSSTRARSGRS